MSVQKSQSTDDAQSQTTTDDSTMDVMGNVRDAVSAVLAEFSEDDTSTFVRFVPSDGETTTIETHVEYTEDSILLAGRVEYPSTDADGDLHFDERVILQNTYPARRMIDDAWEVSHPKYNGDHWHIDAFETLQFITHALSRGHSVIARPALLASVGRHHCPCASCGDSFETAAELAGHLGGMASAGDVDHIEARSRRQK